MCFSETISPLIGRLAIAWFFASTAIACANHWDATVAMMTLKAIPVPPLLLALALMIMWLGALSLAFGYQTRHGAVLLFGYVLVVTAALHAFWTIADPRQQAIEFDVFARNVAIAGGLLLLVGMGPGPFAIDNRSGKGGGRRH